MLMRKMSSGILFRKQEIRTHDPKRISKKEEQWLMLRSLWFPLLGLPIILLSSVPQISKKVKFSTQMGMRWIMQRLALFIQFPQGMEILLFLLGTYLPLLMLILLERNRLRALTPRMKTPLNNYLKRGVGNIRRSFEKKRLRDLRLKEVSPPSKCPTGGIREPGLQREQSLPQTQVSNASSLLELQGTGEPIQG